MDSRRAQARTADRARCTRRLQLFRLAARIADLRQAGHEIKTENRTLVNGKTIAVYHLKEENHVLS